MRDFIIILLLKYLSILRREKCQSTCCLKHLCVMTEAGIKLYQNITTNFMSVH